MENVPFEMDRNGESESALSNSLESVLTVESSHGDADSKLDGWTNEKHNSYLHHLEKSFVRQLYSLLGGEEERRKRRLSRTRHVQSNSHISLRYCQQKVNFGKKCAHLATSSIATSDQGNVLSNEEIENDKAFTRRYSLGHEYPAQCNAEASGQNFRQVGEKRCYSGVFRKRKREANYDQSSINDQVVP